MEEFQALSGVTVDPLEAVSIRIPSFAPPPRKA